jgi:mutator protein MutT
MHGIMNPETREDTRGTREVVAAVVKRDGAYLVCRRPAGKRHGGLWEFPGGKVKPGESREDAVRRELAEELAVEVTTVGEALHVARDPDSRFLIVFVTVEIRGEPQPLEHPDIRWCRLPELRECPLAPGDRSFVREHLGCR